MENLALNLLILILVVCTRINVAQVPAQPESKSIYSFTMKDIEGNDIPLSKYRGKVLLIVNVASECGFTDNHYKELVQLHHTLLSQDFQILAFPCNQYGNQEPKRNKAIQMFAKSEYDVQFQMFSKIKVGGKEAHPLYVWLYRNSGYYPNWNFCKYLIDQGGRISDYADSYTSPMQMLDKIQLLLKGGSLPDLGSRKPSDEL